MLDEIDAATVNATKKGGKLTRKESDQAIEIMHGAGRVSGHTSPSIDENDFEKLMHKFEEETTAVEAMKKINDKLEDSWGSLDDGGASDVTASDSKLQTQPKLQNQDLEVVDTKSIHSTPRAISDMEEDAILEEVLAEDIAGVNEPIFNDDLDEDPYNIIEKELSKERTKSGKSTIV